MDPHPTSSVAPHLRIIQAALDKPRISGIGGDPVANAPAAAPKSIPPPTTSSLAPHLRIIQAALDKPHISGRPPAGLPVVNAAAPAFVSTPAPRMSNPPRPFSMAPFRFSQSFCYHHQNQEKWYASTKPLICEQQATPKCHKECGFLLVCKGCGAAMCAQCHDFYAPRHRRRGRRAKRQDREEKVEEIRDMLWKCMH